MTFCMDDPGFSVECIIVCSSFQNTFFIYFLININFKVFLAFCSRIGFMRIVIFFGFFSGSYSYLTLSAVILDLKVILCVLVFWTWWWSLASMSSWTWRWSSFLSSFKFQPHQTARSHWYFTKFCDTPCTTAESLEKRYQIWLLWICKSIFKEAKNIHILK